MNRRPSGYECDSFKKICPIGTIAPVLWRKKYRKREKCPTGDTTFFRKWVTVWVRISRLSDIRFCQIRYVDEKTIKELCQYIILDLLQHKPSACRFERSQFRSNLRLCQSRPRYHKIRVLPAAAGPFRYTQLLCQPQESVYSSFCRSNRRRWKQPERWWPL